MVIFAHMGGIDEIGIFVVPAVLAIMALRWTERRARERAESEQEKAREAKEADQGGDEPSGGFKLTAR